MSSEVNANEARPFAFQSATKSTLVSPNSVSTNNTNAMYGNNSSNSNGNATGNGNGSSPKMGSRRIFTPQFKLQVLESYRSDSDCKGNQRATARKYNIHRRQIQKWLQCESNLRSSVANINQNNVKHQFHNVSHHQQQQQASQISRLQLTHTNPSASLNGATNGFGHHHHPHHHSQSLALSSLNVPSMTSRLDVANPTSPQGVLAAANLAAAVAVAIARTSPPSNTATAAAISPIRPTAINGTNNGGINNGVSKISPSLLHSHHHHHFPISPYSASTVAGPVPVAMPMLPHHVGAPSQQPHALHQHYPYHNLSPHAHTRSLRLSHQPSAFLPTACLPVNVLSTLPVAPTSDLAGQNTEENSMGANGENKSEVTAQSAATTKTITPVTTMQAATTSAGFTGNVHEYVRSTTDFEYMYRKAIYVDGKSERDTECSNYLQLSAYPNAEKNSSMALMSTPMDLSLGRKKRESEEAENYADNIACHSKDSHSSSTTTQIVDLTFRKRKVIAASALSEDPTHPQKLAKRLEDSNSNKSFVDFSRNDSETNNRCTNDEDEDIDIEVEVEAKQTSSKPVKLFKPYLLDNNNECDQSSTGNAKSPNPDISMGEQREPIIWINHPAYDSSRASSIYSPTVEKQQTFHVGSPNFPASKPNSPHNVLSPMSAASLSPTNFLRCPKGSPVSGYESSSSICSEKDDTCSLNECRSYSLDFQMQTALENKLTSQPLHIRQWLDRDTNTETNTPPIDRASIALYA